MLAVLEDRKPEIAALCERLGVERLEVFGSGTRVDFDPGESDLDFVVRFSHPRNRGYADRYLALAEALEQLFRRRVDLLTERSLRNPIFRRTIASDRRVLYGA